MDVPMTIGVDVTVSVAPPHCELVVPPVVDRNGAADDIDLECNLRSEPIGATTVSASVHAIQRAPASITRVAPIARAAPTSPAVEATTVAPLVAAISADRSVHASSTTTTITSSRQSAGCEAA